MVATGAAAGLAFDGDADRLVAVDERGGLVDGDHILAIAALDLRARGRLRHDTVVATVMANLGFHQAMAAEGIRVETTPVGDRSVLEAMEAGGFSLGGEQSGHIIFGDLATTGDGLLSGLVLLDVLARAGRPLSELAAVVTKLPQVLRNVPGRRPGRPATPPPSGRRSPPSRPSWATAGRVLVPPVRAPSRWCGSWSRPPPPKPPRPTPAASSRRPHCGPRGNPFDHQLPPEEGFRTMGSQGIKRRKPRPRPRRRWRARPELGARNSPTRSRGRSRARPFGRGVLSASPRMRLLATIVAVTFILPLVIGVLYWAID